MKIQITSKTRELITAAQMPAARQIVADVREDDCTPADYVRQAVSALGYVHAETLNASVEIALNGRVCDYFCEGSGHMDVWVHGYALAYETAGWAPTIIEVGAYLSDLWGLCSGQEGNNYSDVSRHFLSVRYRRDG